MKRIAKFEKVTESQFVRDWMNCYPKYQNDRDEILRIYKDIKLPVRATKGSAGYDFFSPISFKLYPGDTIKIPTGIRCKIDNGWVLKCYPRSSLGFKYRFGLDNTVGIIDSDYYDADNEGHILLKMTNNMKKISVEINAGEGIAQGIFVEYGITVDDEAGGIRNGGFGSTGK